jgi:S1-C subfamily serine protease
MMMVTLYYLIIPALGYSEKNWTEDTERAFFAEKLYRDSHHVVCLHLYYINKSESDPKKAKRAGSASGFLVNLRNEPHVVSAGHIVKSQPFALDGVYAFFKTDLRPKALALVGYDRVTDVSLFKFVKSADKDELLRRCVTIGDSRSLVCGQQTFALGLNMNARFSVSAGQIKNLDLGYNVFSVFDFNGFTQPQLIIHDASINRGSSGGPLVDRDGKVVGVNVMVLGAGNGFVPLCVAGPINDGLDCVKRFRGGKELRRVHPPFVLMETRFIDDRTLQEIGLDRPLVDGPMVVGINPFARTGLKAGDVILRCRGHEALTANEVMRCLMIDSREGEVVSFVVDRDGEEITVYLELEL